MLVAVKKTYRIDCSGTVPTFEAVWVRIKMPTMFIIVVACYKPPSVLDFAPLLHDFLESLILLYPNDVLVISGDFNYPEIKWSILSDKIPFLLWQNLPKQSRDFVDVIYSFALSQIVNKPSRGEAMLDLFFISKPNLVAKTVYMEPLSDHISINVELFIPSCEQPLRAKTISSYSRANLDAINQNFSLFSAWFLEEFDSRSLNENWILFKCKLLELCDKFIPKLTIHTSF